MRLSWAGQAVLSGLVAIVTADVLPPDDIPLMCVTICGPIVELTSKCDVHGQRLLKRTTPWVPKLAVEPLEEEVVQVEPRQDGEGVEKRSFSIIRAAPTSFPFELTATAPLEEAQPSTSSMWSVETAADQVATLSTRTSTTTSFSSSSRSTTTVSLPTRSVLHETVATTSSAGWSGGEQTGQLYSHKDPEQECVCNNKSFDVAKIAALCHDCIVVDGHKQNNMDMIMKACNFTELSYTIDDDSAADNIRVEATRPTALASTEAPSTNTGIGVEPAVQRRVMIVGLLLSLALAV
ncbi:hypothetical protein NCS57_00842100 [Fusarium keratoplasticum]|uniref:Uncharacterized protein n=1 Tax=Fusarium keratoplasticum TaxID=1328300 RepID=A0ACC0QVQ9_9HYPO|nr:hypothetical protein NCS57_00842100 [Fusarium keratoplasticum]KAI8666180.1 hypothetical protein NCS57_00842100 [Fusarium keratoplasticum]KAI8667885.1 hypothetical protein NCS55_00811900 [Fusarium keratoplasticum]